MSDSTGGAEPIDDDALEFATGSGKIELCSSPSSCSGTTTGNITVNQTITITTTIH